jgi:hypothetical protein
MPTLFLFLFVPLPEPVIHQAAMIDPPQVLSEEPTAVTPHGRFCGGESQQWPSYPTNPPVRFDERDVETERWLNH